MSEHLSSDPDLYYLQCRAYCGNSLLWWRQGRHGYTCDVRQAHVFTKDEAFSQHRCRPEMDLPWRKDYIDAKVEHHVTDDCIDRQAEGAV